MKINDPLVHLAVHEAAHAVIVIEQSGELAYTSIDRTSGTGETKWRHPPGNHMGTLWQRLTVALAGPLGQAIFSNEVLTLGEHWNQGDAKQIAELLSQLDGRMTLSRSDMFQKCKDELEDTIHYHFKSICDVAGELLLNKCLLSGKEVKRIYTHNQYESITGIERNKKLALAAERSAELAQLEDLAASHPAIFKANYEKILAQC